MDGLAAALLACALAQDAGTLLVARAVSGAFGGLSVSMVLAIGGDVVPAERRAAGVGIIMTAFAVAAALGLDPLNMMLSVPPFATGVPRVRVTTEELDGVIPVTVLVAAVPPGGVYTTE